MGGAATGMSSFSHGGFLRCRLLVLSLRASLMLAAGAKQAWGCARYQGIVEEQVSEGTWDQTQEVGTVSPQDRVTTKAQAGVQSLHLLHPDPLVQRQKLPGSGMP